MHLKDIVSIVINHCCLIVLSLRMNVSYICITHVEGSGFHVYQSKGCPSQETVELMSVPERMEKHIKSLCSNMNYNDDTEIVLNLHSKKKRSVYDFTRLFLPRITAKYQSF